jgi:phage terminase small subunit
MGESRELEGLEDLTVKQRAYVLAYLETGSQRQAALDAGYSPASADQQASVLMKNKKIRAAILRLEAKAVDRVTEIVDVTAEKVISGLWKEAQREGKGASHSARIQAYASAGEDHGDDAGQGGGHPHQPRRRPRSAGQPHHRCDARCR